jgi:hypothetical protein
MAGGVGELSWRLEFLYRDFNRYELRERKYRKYVL